MGPMKVSKNVMGVIMGDSTHSRLFMPHALKAAVGITSGHCGRK
jgi:hypothetical protein